MIREEKRTKTTWASLVVILFAAAALGVLYYLFGCPVKYFTGLSCPGCGMTRALWCALTLRFGAAWRYHPLFWLVPVAALLLPKCVARRYPKGRAVALVGVVTAFVAVYLVRLIFFPGAVVNWEPPMLITDLTNGFARLR